MYIGIDLGGTNIAAGVVDENGRIVCKGSVPTQKERHYSEIIRDMAELAKKLAADVGYGMDDIEAVGIGCPGTIDNSRGMVVYSNNIKMDHVPLADEFRKYIDAPINIENDANAAAYGEYIANGNGAESYIFMTLGTGVGGGIIINGKIYRGFNSRRTACNASRGLGRKKIYGYLYRNRKQRFSQRRKPYPRRLLRFFRSDLR